MKFVPAVIGLLAVPFAGCSSTPAELEAKATPTVHAYSQSYQEIYRNASTTAKRCLASNLNAFASLAVDTELYSDLGYGEIAVSLINWGYRNYYVSARIERDGKGSKMISRAGNSLGADNFLEKMSTWATGDQNC